MDRATADDALRALHLNPTMMAADSSAAVPKYHVSHNTLLAGANISIKNGRHAEQIQLRLIDSRRKKGNRRKRFGALILSRKTQKNDKLGLSSDANESWVNPVTNSRRFTHRCKLRKRFQNECSHIFLCFPEFTIVSYQQCTIHQHFYTFITNHLLQSTVNSTQFKEVFFFHTFSQDPKSKIIKNKPTNHVAHPLPFPAFFAPPPSGYHCPRRRGRHRRICGPSSQLLWDCSHPKI